MSKTLIYFFIVIIVKRFTTFCVQTGVGPAKAGWAIIENNKNIIKSNNKYNIIITLQ